MYGLSASADDSELKVPVEMLKHAPPWLTKLDRIMLTNNLSDCGETLLSVSIMKKAPFRTPPPNSRSSSLVPVEQWVSVCGTFSGPLTMAGGPFSHSSSKKLNLPLSRENGECWLWTLNPLSLSIPRDLILLPSSLFCSRVTTPSTR